MGDELASLQHLTQPGEEEEVDEERVGGGGGRSSSSEQEFATALPPTATAEATSPAPAPATATATATAAESAAPEKRQHDDGGNTNAVIATIVSDEDNNAPIDWILSRRLPENSRRFYRKALEAGDVKVDGRKVRRLIRVKRGARISVDLGTPKTQEQQQQPNNAVATSQGPLVFPERLPRLRVVYEDEHLFAIM